MPWIDAHAHPGRCFLLGLGADDPLVGLLGPADFPSAVAELAAGGVGLAAFATVADLRVLALTPDGLRAGRSFAAGEATADHRRQIRGLVEAAAGVGCRLVRRAADLETLSADRPAVLVSCEGGDFLEGRLDELEWVAAEGARSITLVHYRVNELGDVQTEAPVHGGLTAFGRAVVREMNRLGLVVDLAHATWAVTRDVLDSSSAPVMISHSHLVRSTSPHPRLLSLEHAQAVARAGGLVGAWPAGVALSSFEDFVDEMLRMIDALGEDHVALGTDMHANFRPVLETHRRLPALADALRARGAGETVVRKVLGGNVLRLLRTVLP